jgi:hemolysin D
MSAEHIQQKKAVRMQGSSSTAGSTSLTHTTEVIQLRPPTRWHDPLKLIQDEPPSEFGRIVLWLVSILVLVLIVWAAFGKLDIVATSEGKLVPQTLVKIVQPAEAGVVKQLLINEGDSVKAGQVLARLDTTLASADKASIANDLQFQTLQARRIEAELADRPMQPKAGDDSQRFAQIHSQYIAHRKAFLDSLDQEKSLLTKAEHERKSALEILSKLEQTLPTYTKTADAYAKLEKEGFISDIAASEKQREAIEKTKDIAAQKAIVASLDATIAAQNKKVNQIRSTYQSELQKELSEIHARIAQLQPNLDKTLYREGLMELKAPQDGIIKDLATTTVGAVVQPGTVVMTLVPKDEKLYADVNIKNEDVGFVDVGQSAQIKLAAYPFQKYGMLMGKILYLSADATEVPKQIQSDTGTTQSSFNGPTTFATYKVRIELDTQKLIAPDGKSLTASSGMQVIAEINQGKQTVLEYLLSPVRKLVSEAGRER